MKKRFAVIGNPIAHSLSPIIHQRFAKQFGVTLCYEKLQVDVSAFEQTVLDFFDQGGQGLNITSPFKLLAFQMAEVCTSRCQQAKAANTLWVHEGRLHADSTDGIGLIRDLSRHITLAEKKVLLLGAGGAARSIIDPLLAANIAALMVVNRTVSRAKALQTDFPKINCCALGALDSPYDVIINATSASFGKNALYLPKTLLKSSTYCYDLFYHVHESTSFLSWARQESSGGSDGLGMLIEQAAEAFGIWHGLMPDTRNLILKLRADLALKS